MRPDAPAKSSTPTPDASTPSSPAAPTAPASRPRLNLQKRTVSEAQPSPTAESGDSKASPFGAARPIDTSAREKEIQEKRQLAIRQKQETDAKAREDKKAKEAADKAERAAKAAEKPKSPVQENGKAAKAEDNEENGEESAPPESKYQILQRMNEENGAGEGEAEEDAVDGPANGTIVDDKAIKPQEIVRDPPKRPQQGEWRRKPSAGQKSGEPGPTADKLEEDGWSTVPQKSKSSKRGGGNPPGSRAIAS